MERHALPWRRFNNKQTSVFVLDLFCFFPLTQKEEKSQQHKSRNGVSDGRPAQAPPAPKCSSSDVLKDSSVSLATVSNVNIDIQLHKEEDPRERQVPRAQSFVSHHYAGNVAHSAPKDKRGKGKPDLSPSPTPLLPPQSLISGVGSRGGEESKTPNGLLDIHLQATPDPGETFSDFGEKQTPAADNDDTMELLKEADMQNQKLEAQTAEKHTVRRSTHKPNTKNITQGLEMNMDNTSDTVTLLKGAPTQNHTSDIHVSASSNTGILRYWYLLLYILFCLSSQVCLYSPISFLVVYLKSVFFIGKPRIHGKAVRAVPFYSIGENNYCAHSLRCFHIKAHTIPSMRRTFIRY